MSDGAFDLRRFAPPRDVRFQLSKHAGYQFAVDSDPDVDDVARMLRIENEIRGIGGDGTTEAMQAALEEGKLLLLRMIRERDPDFGELRIGAQELTVIFALLLHGSTVAAAIVEAITASSEREDDAGRAEGDRDEIPAVDELEPVEGGAPLPSEMPSSGRSSISDESEAGRLAIGTA